LKNNKIRVFFLKIKSLLTTNTTSEEVPTLKVETKKLVKNLYSMIDKAVKKGVIHKNTAARKKSRIGLMSKQVQC
jgi:ribosomal protein S20